MTLAILAYLAGILTILSPCILPVLPFVFSRAGEPFRRSGLPLLAGMASTFAAAATLAVAGGTWVIRANEWGRWLAMGLFAVFGLSLIFPSIAEVITRPFTRLGGRLHQQQSQDTNAGRSFLLGAATGLLWAPCAGPILGLILTGAALHGANVTTSLLLLAYALGAATSLAAALVAGGRFLGVLRRYLGADRWVRTILGIAVLMGASAIALGWDRGVLMQLSSLRTESLEQKLVGWLPSAARSMPDTNAMMMSEKPVASGASEALTDRGPLSALSAAVAWINSPPLTSAALRGKVVLLDFWTYSCINCLRTLPYIKAWADKYKESGLVVIGVHTPEFAFEKEVSNVEKAVRDLGVTYSVAVDSHYAIWNAFGNQYWPAHYLIDGSGRIRDHHFGEGEYEQSERVIQQLLAELKVAPVPTGYVHVQAQGAEAPSLQNTVDSPETYLGYARSENQVALPMLKRDQEQTYTLPSQVMLNQWSLGGRWMVQAEKASLKQADGKILFRFHARDLHLVLGPERQGTPVHFIVRLDGSSPREDHGVDTDESGRGVIQEQRLYQLIRQSSKNPIRDRTFEIEFLDPGAQAFAFTFG
jgi:cytochrome c biogenesis protein CcdA/thiol-disulfide isomerase/thioredoxin